MSILKADSTLANAYDDAWEAAWVAKATIFLNTPVAGISKTVGKVLHVGDSMTRSFAYGDWPRSGAGVTASDMGTITWMHANSAQNNGWNLSSSDVTSGNGIGWSDAKVDNIFVNSNLNDAQFAILMMNLPSSAPSNVSVIEPRVNQFIAVGILPILRTIPPRDDPDFDTNPGNAYNTAPRSLAQQLEIPIIDYSMEILLRRPNGTWVNTLISCDGVHPSGGVNGYNSASNPYSSGGDSATHTSGDALLNSGYLLRTWLVIQKMREIKVKVVD